ncbi:DUF6088 family protein [Pectobacterium brasiliense]|uniref:DUF6088 family protein n=1 Tax=Pectobacterium brasiliense TaxID=180957 RepID=UPI00065D585E|nr:DUF6088 family protein [Pectobacterium brasiliense]KMK81828.1 hypothetical protein KCO_20842 [Pectobacterium brasiliense ICMP 19477]
MKIKPLVEKEISRFEPGKVFTYRDLTPYISSPETTVKAVSRLVKNGDIKRFAKGHFYRPKKGMFGEMQLSDTEKLKTFMYQNGERRGYVTGTGLYNRLGLTTQIPRTITIASDKSPQRKNLGNVEVKLVKAKVPVSESNREYLEILDVLSNIKKIPDSNPSEVMRVIAKKLKNIKKDDLHELINLASVYSPVTRALLGLLTEKININLAMNLKSRLNPTTRYRIGLDSYWDNAEEWNIE